MKVGESRGKSGKVKFFHDTGTALIEFSARNVVKTQEISENIYVTLRVFHISISSGRRDLPVSMFP